MGECGLRGGYVEVINLDPAVKRVLLKSVSAKLCSSVLGQCAMDCVVNPPKPGEPSYDLFIKEKTAVLDSLKKRAQLVADTFNSFEGRQRQLARHQTSFMCPAHIILGPPYCPPLEKLQVMLSHFKDFHHKFMNKYK
ncbi:hypothetical protein MTO96_013898 [Rhipicephalus appendiculatus]